MNQIRKKREEGRGKRREKRPGLVLSPPSSFYPHGFTLVEMMLVVVIIGVLAAMVVPRLASRPQQAKIARAKADIGVIGQSIDLYQFDMDGYPERVEDLVARPSGEAGERWNGPYVKGGLPKDPWGRVYVYNKKTSESSTDYELYSLGPDGQPGNDDVKLE